MHIHVGHSNTGPDTSKFNPFTTRVSILTVLQPMLMHYCHGRPVCDVMAPTMQGITTIPLFLLAMTIVLYIYVIVVNSGKGRHLGHRVLLLDAPTGEYCDN